jgi:hypothetical protein
MEEEATNGINVDGIDALDSISSKEPTTNKRKLSEIMSGGGADDNNTTQSTKNTKKSRKQTVSSSANPLFPTTATAAVVDTHAADTGCTVDKSKTSFYWRMPRSVITNIICSVLIFNQFAFQFKRDDKTGKFYIIGVFQHSTAAIQSTRMDQEEIEETGGELHCNCETNIGFQPMKIWQLLNKASNTIPCVEIFQEMNTPPSSSNDEENDEEKCGNDNEASIVLVIGPWRHKISLLSLDTYRHTRPPKYNFDACYRFDPTSLLANLVQAKNVPSNARSARELQVVFKFLEHGVEICTAKVTADPNSQSSVYLSGGVRSHKGNCDKNSILEIKEFSNAVTQNFDLKLLQAIMKACSLLTNEIEVSVAQGRTMQIFYKFPGGKTRLFIADQLPLE